MNPNDYYLITPSISIEQHGWRLIVPTSHATPIYESAEIEKPRAEWRSQHEWRGALPKAWARDWFADAARCPHCESSESMHTIDRDSDGGSTIETWQCDCGGRWRVELREAALLIEEEARDDNADDWIERETPDSFTVTVTLRPTFDTTPTTVAPPVTSA